MSRFGDDSPEHRVNSAKTLATVQHMHKGTPYVYQGEELGMTNTYFTTIEQYRDIESINYHTAALSLGMEVEAVLHSLVGEESGQCPYADAVGRHLTRWVHRRDSVAAGQSQLRHRSMPRRQIEDPDSVFHHFRKLIKLRHDHPVVVHGRFELLLPDHEQIWALTRTLDDQVLMMIANCSSEPASVPADAIPDLTGAQVLLATHGDSTVARAGAVGVTYLSPWLSWPPSAGSGAVSWSAGVLSCACPGDERQGERGAGCREQIGHLVAPDVGALAERRLRHDPAGVVRSVSRRTGWWRVAGTGIMPFR